MKNSFSFILITIISFATSFAALFAVGLVPDEIKSASLAAHAEVPTVTLTKNASGTQTSQWITEVDPTALPTHIIIEKIGVDADVANPSTTDSSVLDQGLLNGAVHYPGSGFLKDTSNIFIFGHSTSHSVVRNEAYKTFNRLNELNIGDVIKVDSVTDEYTYLVTSVSKATADERLVTFSNQKRMLTISTCDSFGQKSDRFVVEAEFLKSSPKVVR